MASVLAEQYTTNRTETGMVNPQLIAAHGNLERGGRKLEGEKIQVLTLIWLLNWSFSSRCRGSEQVNVVEGGW
jgi:hypothetical protein